MLIYAKPDVGLVENEMVETCQTLLLIHEYSLYIWMHEDGNMHDGYQSE